MKIAIVGSKGIPANYGGYETFAEEISMILKTDNEILVVGDKSNDYEKEQLNGVSTINSKYLKSKNPIRFYHQSLAIAKSWNADACIMCGIGGVFSIPFYYRSKMKIFVNPDGLGFKREKWPWWKKKALFIQFLFGAYFAEYLICDSLAIRQFFNEKFRRTKNLFVAEYGSRVNNCELTNKSKVLKDFKLQKNKYYLVVSRIEPENNVKEIIEGYLKSPQLFPLIIVGNTNTRHSKKLLELKSKNVRFFGGIYDKDKLSVLRFCCKAYFHGHSVGGTNPSLLEAMGSNNLIIAHDNTFNREVLHNKAYFFREGILEIPGILNKIESSDFESDNLMFKKECLLRIQSYYNWENISKKYISILTSQLQ